MSDATTAPEPTCSFCGKAKSHVKKMVGAATGATICDECTLTSFRLVLHGEPKKPSSAHPEKVGHCLSCAADIEDLKQRLAHTEKLIEQLDDVLSEIVRERVAIPSDMRNCPHVRPGAWLCPHCHPVPDAQSEPTWSSESVPAALPTEETVPARKVGT